MQLCPIFGSIFFHYCVDLQYFCLPFPNKLKVKGASFLFFRCQEFLVEPTLSKRLFLNLFLAKQFGSKVENFHNFYRAYRTLPYLHPYLVQPIDIQQRLPRICDDHPRALLGEIVLPKYRSDALVLLQLRHS